MKLTWLLKPLLLFVLLIIIAEVVTRSISLPYYWGNDLLSTKIHFLEEEGMDPNNYFIGSSITYRQAMPSVFDSLLQTPKQTFNLAADGAMPPQTFHVFDHLIETDPTIEYIFFELNSYDDLNARMFQSTRSKYYFTLGYLGSSLNYLYHTTIKFHYKVWMALKYGITYLENLFKIGMRGDYMKFKAKANLLNFAFMGKYGDGCSPFTTEITKNKKMSARLPEYAEQQKLDLLQAYSNVERNEGLPYNKELRQQLDLQLQKASAKDIRLIYVLNPFAYPFDNADEMVSLFHSLPIENRIDMANPLKYPAFYQVVNRWDEGHLNAKGAAIYSRELSLAFQTIK